MLIKNQKVIIGLFLTTVIAVIAANLFFAEQNSRNNFPRTITDISYKRTSSLTLQDDLSTSQGFTPMKPIQALSMYSLPMKEYDFNKYILRLNLSTDGNKYNIVHIQGVYGTSLDVYDSSFKSIYRIDPRDVPIYYFEFFSELYIPTSEKTLYIVSDVNRTSDRIGLFREPTISNFNISQINSYNFSEARHAIGFFLVILSVFLFIAALIIAEGQSRAYVLSLSSFTACFGLWILTDIYRHSLWIENNLPLLNKHMVVLLFAISNNFLIPAFVKVNFHIVKNKTSKIIIDIFYRTTFVFAFACFLFEIMRLFYWSLLIDQIYTLTFTSFSYVMIIGSVFLLLLSLFEIKNGDIKSKIYAIGLSICIITFTISQSTSILISHWGVICLLFTLALINALNYKEAQQAANCKLTLNQAQHKALDMPSKTPDLNFDRQKVASSINTSANISDFMKIVVDESASNYDKD